SDEPGAVQESEVAGLHHQLRAFRRLRRRLAPALASGDVTHLAQHEVWAVERMAAGADTAAAGTGEGAADDTVGASAGAATASSRDDPAAARRLLPRFAIHALTRAGGDPRRSTIHARSVILATGAYDLQVPFPGWDLPGVMTAGGVQSLLKG